MKLVFRFNSRKTKALTIFQKVETNEKKKSKHISIKLKL